MTNKLKSYLNILEKIQKFGWVKFILVTLFIIFCFYLVCCRDLVASQVIDYVENIQQEKHDKRLQERDKLISDLGIILREFRADVDADRILYFEYHNSKENLVKIPFKYIDLVSMYTKYNVPGVENFQEYHDISSGLISEIYGDLSENDIIFNKGASDLSFRKKYPNEYSFFMKDGSVEQTFVNLSGINTPIGFIILEWTDENSKINYGEVKTLSLKYASRINALVIKGSGIKD